MAKLFISHRGADAAEAERLAKALRDRGHRVWLDEWEIRVGDLIPARMNDGLADSAYLILCLSASGVLAPWISQEWMTALARQLEGDAIKLLPVRLTGGDLPAILAGTKYADLVKDWDAGLAALLKALR